MPQSELARKLKLKPGHRVALLHAPAGYLKTLGSLASGVTITDRLSGKFDLIQLFVPNRAALEKEAPRAIQALKPESLLWITYPKGSSKLQTDLTRDKGWESLQHAELKWVTLISVDETWSAFALRPYKDGEARQSWS